MSCKIQKILRYEEDDRKYIYNIGNKLEVQWANGRCVVGVLIQILDKYNIIRVKDLSTDIDFTIPIDQINHVDYNQSNIECEVIK